MTFKTITLRAWALAALSLSCLALAVWAMGCSKGPGPEATESRRQGLVGPLPITLAAPMGVSPIAPAIEATNSVEVGSVAGITGTVVAMGAAAGGINAGPQVTMTGDAWSRGGVNFGPELTLTGTLHAAITTIDPSASVGALDGTPTFDPPSTLSWTVNFPAGSGATLHVTGGNAATIAPGLFQGITVDSNATLTMQAGTYYVTDLNAATGSTVTLDQRTGPIIVYVTDSIALNGTFAPLQAGSAPDLLIAYLGTAGVSVGGASGTAFNGAIIAPSSQLSLLQASSPHTGFFAAQDVLVDVEAQVQYAPPIAVVVVSNPTGCGQLLSGLVPPAQLSTACRCASADDTDRDGVPDCIDGCPYDPNKIRAGLCGCGTPDTDSDGDGVPDCIDQCPNDPNNTTLGQCGCIGLVGRPPAPAGTLCTDTACPQSGAACDGAGVCGNRNACTPAPGCRLITSHGVALWFCAPLSSTSVDGGTGDAGSAPPAQTWQDAQNTCSAKGLTLTRIDSLDQNRFIDRLITAPLWLGANDLTFVGTWRWAAPGTSDGDQFWSGGPSGSPVASRFAHWASTAPGSQQCATLLPFDGHWVDTDCSEQFGYICGFRQPIGLAPDGGVLPPLQPPGISDQPLPHSTACIPEPEAGLPDSTTELQNEILQARAGTFGGAAANPPPDGSVCPINPLAQGIGLSPDAGIGCDFVNVIRNRDCITDSDCPSGFICRQEKNVSNPPCNPPDASPGTFVAGETCKGHSVCGQLACPTVNNPCDQVIVCNPGSSYDAGLAATSTLTPGPFNPATLFDGGIPDSGPSAAYSDPPSPGHDQTHPWCQMQPQDPNSVQAPATPTGQYHGQTDNGPVISFAFDPDLEFDLQANPLALGETKLMLHAKGSLDATVSLNKFLGQDFTGSILEASIGVEADRCFLDDVSDTTFKVFGLDAIDPFSFGIPKVNTKDPSLDANLASLSNECSDSVGNFLLFADRAKKAFRDAQQLLSQYYAIKNANGNLGSLCQQIGVAAAVVPFFPGGNQCFDDETPEFTINRFIDYYQLPGSGQIAQLKNAAGQLQSATSALRNSINSALPNLNAAFGADEEESQTILDAPFAIGPVPMVLEVDVFADYGVDGNLDISLDFPIGLDGNQLDTPQPVAKANVSVVPHASAGLSAFVGAGFDFGALSVELGIEGALNLADAHLPIFAGAELDEEITQDFRPLENGVGPPVSLAADLTHFGVPTAFKFSVAYNYGARVDLDKILAGTINAELHIEFFFFSRTWRKQIVQFNGFDLHFDLINGGTDPSVAVGPQPAGNSGTGQVASAAAPAPLGRSEPQVPLMVLGYLPGGGIEAGAPVDGGVDLDGAAVPFDGQALQRFFYDDLCCAKVNDPCATTGTPHCCPGLTCPPPDASVFGQFCVQGCRPFGTHCASDSDCCAGLLCGSGGICQSPPCAASGATCITSADCCSGLVCGSSNTCVQACEGTGAACSTPTECCSGQCVAGQCGSLQ